MFAAVNGNVIHIYSVTSFENILSLKGHNGKVSQAGVYHKTCGISQRLVIFVKPLGSGNNASKTYSTNPLWTFLQVRGIEWSLDDSRLVSCGMEGAVYEWNTQSGKRVSESVLNSCSYTDVAFSSDCKSILAVGTDLTLREIQDCQVSTEWEGVQWA